MEEVVHVYKHRAYYNNVGKTLCGILGTIRNNGVKHAHFNHSTTPHSVVGTTRFKTSNCISCLEVEVGNMEAELKEAKIRLEGLRIAKT